MAEGAVRERHWHPSSLDSMESVGHFCAAALEEGPACHWRDLRIHVADLAQEPIGDCCAVARHLLLAGTGSHSLRKVRAGTGSVTAVKHHEKGSEEPAILGVSTSEAVLPSALPEVVLCTWEGPLAIPAPGRNRLGSPRNRPM